MIHRIFFIRTIVLSGIFYLTTGTLLCVAETAEEVLAKSAEAMRPPCKIIELSNGTQRTVYIRDYSDGIIGHRIDGGGALPLTEIFFNHKSYQIFHNSRTIIDKSIQYEDLNVYTGNLRSKSGASDQPEFEKQKLKSPVSVSNRFDIADSKIDGHDCFMISETRSSGTRNVKYIDKSSYIVLKEEDFRRDGTRRTETICVEFTRPVTISDDVFLPPEGYKICVATNAAEASALSSAIIEAELTPKKLPDEIEPVFGLVLPGSLPGSELEQKKTELKAKLVTAAALLKKLQGTDVVRPIPRQPGMWVVTTLIAVALIGVIVFRWYRSAGSSFSLRSSK